MRWFAAIILIVAVGGLSVALLDSGPAETPVVGETYDHDEAMRQYEGTMEIVRSRTPVIDYMAKYGTDNPAILDENAVPSSVEIVGTPDFMKLYGTDNPVFLAEADIAQTVDHGEYFRLYGTENPVFAEERSFMELYGTDNPVFVEEEERSFMELYGTDNPVFLPEAEAPVNTGEYFRLYWTENPVFVGR